MIRECRKSDSFKISCVINNAAAKYKGVIPYNCWHEPYMSNQELVNEFTNGVRMFGYNYNDKLIGVAGIQKIKNVTLIRHAYILRSYQRKGVGSKLLKYLLKKNKNSRLLVGTWKKATWAIRFYEKFDFILHSKIQSTQLLKVYWKIPLIQTKNSVVLERYSK